jgi:hypothetical protein
VYCTASVHDLFLPPPPPPHPLPPIRNICMFNLMNILCTYIIELHIYIEEVERKGLGRETGLQLTAMSFSKKLSFFL